MAGLGGNGKLGTMKRSESGETPSALLQAQGVIVVGNSVESFFESLHVPAATLKSGVTEQTRPAEAPVANTRKLREGSR